MIESMSGDFFVFEGKEYRPVRYCKDCRWWNIYPAARGGACTRMEQPASLAYGEPYEQLITKPDFGCVMWEGKNG